jgi:hypothetical protein
MNVKTNSEALKLISFDVCGWKVKNKLKGGEIKGFWSLAPRPLKCDDSGGGTLCGTATQTRPNFGPAATIFTLIRNKKNYYSKAIANTFDKKKELF